MRSSNGWRPSCDGKSFVPRARRGAQTRYDRPSRVFERAPTCASVRYGFPGWAGVPSRAAKQTDLLLPPESAGGCFIPVELLVL